MPLRQQPVAMKVRWFGETAIEVAVDTIDGRVVTTWRKHPTK
jgi:hypothetical protein